jgi:hypothetical protein
VKAYSLILRMFGGSVMDSSETQLAKVKSSILRNSRGSLTLLRLRALREGAAFDGCHRVGDGDADQGVHARKKFVGQDGDRQAAQGFGDCKMDDAAHCVKTFERVTSLLVAEIVIDEGETFPLFPLRQLHRQEGIVL